MRTGFEPVVSDVTGQHLSTRPTHHVASPGSSPAAWGDMWWALGGPPFSTCSQSPEALTALQYHIMGLSKDEGVDLDRALIGGEGGIRTLWTLPPTV